MATNTVGLNQVFQIYNEDGTPFHDLVLRKGVVDSVVMSLGDKITGEVYYIDNTLNVTMKEYIEYNDVHYMLVNPPTIVREGMVADNSELKGTTKYSFEFYHPMCQLSNFPFTDVATKSGEEKYLSQNKTFSWIGNPQDYFDKLNKNLQGTVWHVRKSDRFPTEKNNELSDVQQFDKISIAEAIKRGYEIWGVPYIVSQLPQTDPLYSQGKRFVVEYGLPSNEIYESGSSTPFVFQMGKGVGLKNNSRTPRNNKIITRISGSGSESNIPYGYPQIIWYGNQDWDYTINNNPNDPNSYPIYKGIVGGQYVKLIKHPFTRTNLMPSIYSQTVFNKVSPYLSNGQANPSYSPAIEIKDYYDAIATQEYPYTNEINPQAPSYESHEFEDIKPEFDSSESMGIVSAIPLNADLTPADHWDDSMDDDGNYLQSYFQITLPQLSFDLYACAAITQEMQINMRSGACIGCTFPIQVDWDDYKANFYDSDGNFVPDGAQRDLTKYPKSNLGQISVVVQKDNSTFGALMPNIYQQPTANDLFVFIGISLPLSYITSAEERLDDAMKTYMLENNVYYYDYPLKFDEYFLATHTNILEQIRPNSIIHFMFGGVEQQLFVKQLTIKYNNTPLPQYDITLTDNIEVVLNQIGQVVDDVEKLSSLLSVLRQSYNRNVWNELAKKLSKTQDDTASGYIRMLKGLQVGANFVPDILGEGGVLRMRDDGKVELVTDILYARMRAYFDSVVIREYRHESGNRIKSPAQGFNASRIEYIKVVDNVETIVDDASEADFFRCYWRVDDGEKKAENQFIIGDLAFCQHADIVNGSLVTKRYWRVVTGRNAGNTTTDDGEAWIDLSNAHDANGNPVMTTIYWEGQGGTTQTLSVKSFESSANGYPEAHDDICMLGCVVDTTRQGAIIEYVSGVDAPTYQIYQGLGSDATNPYTLSNKNQIGFGYNTGTGRAYMNVYGDAYIGDPNGSTFVKYNQSTKKLEIKAEVSLQSTFGGESLDEYIQDHTWTQQQIEALFTDDFNDIDTAIENIQKQVDGAIETWFYDGVPTLSNLPASNWTTTDERINHLGDLYYDNLTGYAYRFKNTGTDEHPQFEWGKISDQDVTKALADAAKAQDTADHKRRVFVRQPLASEAYDVGDLWVNATYSGDGASYANDVLRCNTAKAKNVAFSITHWEKASKYTDDSTVRQFIDVTFPREKQGLQNQIDGKIESWFSTSDPASSWTDDDTKAKHVGDMWYNSSTHLLKRYTFNGSTYSWETVEDQKAIDAYNNAATAQYTANGKRTVFTTQPTPPYMVGDLWAQGTSGDIMRCTNARADGSYDASDWEKASKYTDDSALDTFKLDQYVQLLTNGTISQNITNAQNAADGAQSTANSASSAASAAQTAADNAASAASAAQGSADAANNKLATWADDDYISPQEKTALSLTKEDIVKEYTQIVNDATKYSVSYSDFTTAYNNAITAINYYIDSSHWSDDIQIQTSGNYNYGYIAAYYTARQAILDAIATEAKKVATDAQARADSAYTLADSAKTDAQTADAKAAALGYLSQALGQDTTIAGGLVLSTLIGLRDGNGRIWSGINGAYQAAETGTGYKGHGIAAWYGGAMVDKEISTTATDYAKSLFRFDGSGYLAGGNISWDASGNALYKGAFEAISSSNGGWRINPYTDIIAIPTIDGVNKSGTTVFRLIFDADTSDLSYPHDYGGLYISDSSNFNNPDAEYAREAWLISSHNNTNIYMTAWVGSQNPYIHGVSYNNKDFYIGVNEQGLRLQASQWPQLSNVVNNQVYVDTSYGILRVKGYNDSSLPWGGGGGGTVTSITAGTGLSGGTITGSGTISISSTYQTYISNGNTAYGWGDHANAGYITSSGFGDFLESYCHDNYVNIGIFYNNVNYATQSWVQQQGYITSSADTKNTTGSTNDNTNRLYLVGALSQANYAQTYSSQYVFVQNGILYTTKTNGGLQFGGQCGIWDEGQDELVIDSTNTITLHAEEGVYITGSDGIYLNASLGVEVTGIFSAYNDIILNHASNESRHLKIYSTASDYADIYADGNGLNIDATNSNDQLYLTASTVSCNNDLEVGGDVTVDTILYVYDISYLGGTSSQNAIVNIADSAQIVQTNQTYQPYLLFHKPNVNWTRLAMADDGTIEVREGEDGTAFRRFACGRITVDGGSDGYGLINIDGDGINIIGHYTDADCVYLLANLIYCSGNTEIDGDCYANSFIQNSDVRLKNIVSDLNLNIYNVANAPIFKYTWKDGKDNQALHVGTSAQYWQTVLPETVSEKKDGMLAMQYDVVALAAAVITAKTVASHDERIKILENENKVLREEIELLKKRVN